MVYNWKEKEKWVANPEIEEGPPNSGSGFGSNPTRGECSGTKVVVLHDAEVIGKREEERKGEEGKLGFTISKMEKPETEGEDVEESKRQSEEEDEELCSVYFTMEDFDNVSKRQIEAESEDERMSNLAMVMVEEDAQAITTDYNPKIVRNHSVEFGGCKNHNERSRILLTVGH